MQDLPSPRVPALPRGGARNRSDRISYHLTERQARMVLCAAERSLERGTPFNRFITVAWERGGLSAKSAVKATGEFITSVREWLRGHREHLDWAWVQESTPGNAHCHILLHIPPAFDRLFGSMPRRWVKKLLGGRYVKRAVNTRRLELCMSPWAHAEAQRAELMAKVHYMLKTTPAQLEDVLGMTGRGYKPWGRSCAVYGKRCAVRPRFSTPRSKMAPVDAVEHRSGTPSTAMSCSSRWSCR